MLTLPKWFWIIYYIILFSTLISGVINWVRQRYSVLSAITIILSLLVPMVSFVYTVGRTEGLNEFQYLFAQLGSRDPWALFIVLGYLYLLVWWYFFISSLRSIQLSPRLNKVLEPIEAWFRQTLARKKKERDGNRD